MAKNDLTAVALEGWQAGTEGKRTEATPYYFSSDNWLGWCFGNLAARKGLPKPAEVLKSRGFSVRVSDLIYKISDMDAASRGRVEFVRL